MTTAQDDARQTARRRLPTSSAEAAPPSGGSDIVGSTNAGSTSPDWESGNILDAAAISPIRKAAIVLVSLEQSLASQLLSHLDRATVEAVTWEIARLDGVDPVERELVLEEFYGLGLRRLCFVFDDLIKISDTDIRVALDDDDLETWSLALAGAAAAVRAKVLGALSAHVADQLQFRLEHLGPFRLSDSEAAQLQIAERIRRLHDRGRISLPEPSGSDEVLV
jgi:flagellar motor switch protein FliG